VVVTTIPPLSEFPRLIPNVRLRKALIADCTQGAGVDLPNSRLRSRAIAPLARAVLQEDWSAGVLLAFCGTFACGVGAQAPQKEKKYARLSRIQTPAICLQPIYGCNLP